MYATTFHRDSLRAWYARVLTVSGDILLAKDYAAEGDYTTARQILDNISNRYSLSTLEQNDITDIDTIFAMLDVRGINGLTQGDLDDLIEFSDNKGHSSSIARSLLMLNGYRFETKYVLPNSGPEPFLFNPENTVPISEGVTLYPNPNNGDYINITIREHSSYLTAIVEIWNLTGTKLLTISLNHSHSILKLPSNLHGGFVYRISGDGNELRTGKVVLVK